jgi:hypothetical protein
VCQHTSNLNPAARAVGIEDWVTDISLKAQPEQGTGTAPCGVATGAAKVEPQPELRASQRSRGFWGSGPRPVFRVLLYGALVRAIYHFGYVPGWCADSVGYADAGYLLSHGYFTDGARTPIYPLFLAFSQRIAQRIFHVPSLYKAEDLPYLLGMAFDVADAQIATAIQSLLGLLACCLLYLTLRELRVSERLAMGAAIGFALLHAVCQFEMLILAQSLSLFSLMLAIWLFTKTMVSMHRGRKPLRLALLTGTAFGGAALVRAENLVFFASILLFTAAVALRSLWMPAPQRRGPALALVVVVLPLAAAPMLLAWMSWNYVGVHRFRISTLAGSMRPELFAQLDPEDRVLAELGARHASIGQLVKRRAELPLGPPRLEPRPNKYLEWRVGQIVGADAHRYTHSFLNATKIPPMPERNPQELSDYVGRVTAKSVKNHPGLWIRYAAYNFAAETFRFSYPPPIARDLADVASLDGQPIVKYKSFWYCLLWWNRLQAPLLTCLYVLTLGYFIFGPMLLLRAQEDSWVLDAAVTAVAFGTVGTFLALCVYVSYNRSYAVPYLGALVVCAIYALDNRARFLSVFRQKQTGANILSQDEMPARLR